MADRSPSGQNILRIAETLDRIEQHLQSIQPSRCKHNATGICMTCVTDLLDYRLAQLSRDIWQTVDGAVRRG